MKFKTKVDKLYWIIAVVVLAFFARHLIWYTLYFWSTVGFVINAIALLLVGAFLVIIGKISYVLSGTHLIYRMAFFRGEIEIGRIREIVVGQNMYTGFKPAAARNGLTIKYDKYEDIYISPDTNEAFIAEIVKVKPDIKIVK